MLYCDAEGKSTIAEDLSRTHFLLEFDIYHEEIKRSAKIQLSWHVLPLRNP